VTPAAIELSPAALRSTVAALRGHGRSETMKAVRARDDACNKAADLHDRRAIAYLNAARRWEIIIAEIEASPQTGP